MLLVLAGCRKTEVVYDNEPDSDLKLPNLLTLDGKSCVYDSERGILEYSIEKAALVSFSPLVTFQEHSKVTFNGVPLSNNTVNVLGDLELYHPYSVRITAQNETREFQLIFTAIPIVQLISHDPFVNGPNTLARLVMNYPDPLKESTQNWVGIEQRGRSSLAFEKKSLSIDIFADKSTDFPSSQAYFDFPPNHRWILDAMFVDRSRLRNRTSFELWESIPGPADHIGIGFEFVKVYINHQDQGIYSFNQTYSEELLNLSDQSVIYHGTDNSVFTKFIEMPSFPPTSFNWADWEQEYPRASNGGMVWHDFVVLCNQIVTTDDAMFKNSISSYIDLENVIDYYLFVSLCGGFDNVGKNWLFFKRDHASKFTILPWDLDGTWGRNPFGEETNHLSLLVNHFFKRLEATNPEDYNNRVKSRWEELRSGPFSTLNLTHRFDANFEELKSYEVIDKENQLWQTDLNLNLERAYISNWITNRLAFLDAYFE